MGGRRRRKARNKQILIIAALLVLCILAAWYITRLAGNKSDPQNAADQTQEVVTDTAEDEETEPEEDAGDSSEHAEAAEHVYSYRGSQSQDEFTFDAYDAAVGAGSQFIEADMVVSADGTAYVAHDDYAKDMTGYDGYFSGMSDSQIDSIKTREGHKILKLSELFDKYGDSVTYIIDIKYSSQRNITAFTELVKKYEYEDNVIAASFYTDAIRPLESSFPDMTKMFLASDQGSFNLGLGFDYVDILSVPVELKTEDNIKAAHDSDKKFNVRTLNTEEEIHQAIDEGVDSYFTDETELAIGLEEQYR